MSHLLEVKNLDVKFDTDEGRITAVENISLSVDQGEVLGIVGESGSGKSSLALSILRLIKSKGFIKFDGNEILSLNKDSLRKLRKKMQIVFQDPYSSLSPRMTIEQIILEGLDIHHEKMPYEEKLNLIKKNLHRSWFEFFNYKKSLST